MLRQHREDESKNELQWDGRAVSSYCQSHHSGPSIDSFLSMCAEDIGVEIWSHFPQLDIGSGRSIPEPVRLVDCSDELRTILIGAVPSSHSREDLSGAVCWFAKSVASQFVFDEDVPFEVQIGWHRPAAAERRMEGARLFRIHPESLLRLGPRLYQRVPGNEGAEDADARFVRLDTMRVVRFKPPNRYRRALRKIKYSLPLIGRSEHVWMMNNHRQTVPEEFETVRQSYTERRARLSSPIGWNARGLFSPYISKFHWMCRELQWKRFCIETRESILITLSDAFRAIGSARNEKPRLIWERLPTLSDVEQAEGKILGNGAPFCDLMKPFRAHTLS